MALHASAELTPTRTEIGDSCSLHLDAKEHPPANVSLTVEWSPALPVLRVDLPFPASGGRFTRSNGGVLPNGASLTLKRAHDVHVQVFDQNPSTPRRYRLELHLQGESQGSRLRRAEIEVPLDVHGVGDLRLFEIESTLNGLFSQSDHLDACLEVNLLAGSVTIRTLRVNRYDVELEREHQKFTLSSLQLAATSPDQLRSVDFRAIPLLDRDQEPRQLPELPADEQAGRSWSVAELPASHSPWLVYSGEASTLMARPTLWASSAFDCLGTLLTLGDKACPLARAMSSPITDVRDRELVKVVAAMTDQFDHPSWRLISHHYAHLKHLPLNTLDYWRVIGRSQDACLAALLKFPADTYELMAHMRDELGVMWEFTSRSSLLRATGPSRPHC
ncbi:STY4851/ECs_5259 family protein [Ottowia beijingensis]|uniref:STY4851/ECs_5259 family protein n=1 Tax=Ottowia beijingensis TaxID=1207057 RepID=UPI00358DA74B